MKSLKPYTVRALYQWILDNQLTPYILVKVDPEKTSIPKDYLNEDNTVILNINPKATESLELLNTCIKLNVRFGGKRTPIKIPMRDLLGIYAKENQLGHFFTELDNINLEEELAPIKPTLTLVKK